MNQNPLTVHNDELRRISPAMRYNGNIPFEKWQSSARERLRMLVGINKITPAKDDCFKIEEKTDNGSYTDCRFSFQSEDGYFVPCHLLIPKTEEEKNCRW
jgi:hypothetical protein